MPNVVLAAINREIARSISASTEVSELGKLFDEEPLPLKLWMEDQDHMQLAEEPLSPIQFDVLRHVEQIYFPDTYTLLSQRTLLWRPVRFINFGWMMVGKGGGKDRVAALTQLRIAYLCMCLRHPQRYFRIGMTSKIDMLNTAASEGQAEAIFFEELKGLLGHAPWFRGKYRATSHDVVYEKRILAHSGNSKEEAQEGMNLLLGVLDEIDAFRTKEELEKTARTARGAMLNAQGIFDMMHTSGSSRFPFNFKVLGLSWPRFVGSFIHTKHRQGLEEMARNPKSRTYVIPRPNGAATWESNPTKKRSDFDADFAENPELSRAKYMCLPPESEAPYFRNRLALDLNFKNPWPYTRAPGVGDAVPITHAYSPARQEHAARHREPLTVDYYWGTPNEGELEEGPLDYIPDSRGVNLKEGWQVRYLFDPAFTCDDSYPRAIHVDTGIVHDRCGLCMAHVHGFTTVKVKQRNELTGEVEEVLVNRPLVTVDLVTFLEAPKATPEHPRGEVELRWARRLIFELVSRGFPIHRVTYDGYQSRDSIQILTAHGIEADLFSLDRNMEGYDTSKTILYGGGMRCYPHSLLEMELRALTVINGKKVDHPPGGSKDVADAWAGAIFNAVDISDVGGMSEHDFLSPDTPGWGDELRGIERRSPSGSVSALPADLSQFVGTPRR